MVTTTPQRLSPLSASAAAATTTKATPASPLLASSFKRKTMSVTQTYYLAHKARAKLSHEAARPDHDLRLLVGHANLLDSLMLELADAEREQESWFNQSVRGATKSQEKERHIQWVDTVVEEPEEDWQAEDAESDSDSESDSDYDEDDEDVVMADVVPLRRVQSHVVPALAKEDSMYGEVDEEEDDDEEEDFAQLTLTRSPSHSASPPELDHDSDSSDDESMPPSPPNVLLHDFSEKEQAAAVVDSIFDARQDEKDSFYQSSLFVPPRNPARLVTAISVY